MWESTQKEQHPLPECNPSWLGVEIWGATKQNSEEKRISQKEERNSENEGFSKHLYRKRNSPKRLPPVSKTPDSEK